MIISGRWWASACTLTILVATFARPAPAAAPVHIVKSDLRPLIRVGAQSPVQFAVLVPHAVSTTTGGAWSNAAVDFARRRQLLVFDRFLARLVSVLRDTVLLKGGLVLELRLDRARTTKDIDLRLIGSPETVLTDLQKAGRQVLGDFMNFEVSGDTEQPKIQNDGMKYEGLRFRAECRLAGKLYGRAFGVDVAFGDPILGEPEVVTADDVLEFVGIAPPVVRLYPVETHIAEKLHAYMMPRARPETVTKIVGAFGMRLSAQAA